MTPLQQLSLLTILAAAVGVSPVGMVSTGKLAPAALTKTAAVANQFVITPAIERQIRTNAAHSLAIDIPSAYRQHNWNGTVWNGKAFEQQGSCAWASLVNLLHWQGHHDQAEHVRTHFSAGAGPDRLYPALDSLGIPYAKVPSSRRPAGDESFLEWACRTRRGACVPVGSWCSYHRTRHPCEHMINLVGIDHDWVYLLDNNGYRETYRRSRADFMRDWKESGGWAFTPVYSPAPPKPWTLTTETTR